MQNHSLKSKYCLFGASVEVCALGVLCLVILYIQFLCYSEHCDCNEDK